MKILELMYMVSFTSFVVFLVSNHPFIMAISLVSLSSSASALLGWTTNKWFFYSLFLVYLGGMMVMFTYVASISCLEKMLPPKLKIKYILMIGVSSIWLAFPPLLHYPQVFLFSFNSGPLIMLVLLLILSLIVSMNISWEFKGSLMSSI